MRTALTALAGWTGINLALIATLAAHEARVAWRTRRTVRNNARRHYTAEALTEAQTRHPAGTWNPGHDHGHDTPCQPHCPTVLEAIYLAPAASVQR